MYFQTVRQMSKQLGQIHVWFDAAEAHGTAKGFDPDGLLQARLAPDQFNLLRQVQVACDTAKAAAGRLTGKEAPAHADTEQTIAELRTRISSCREYLDGLTAEDFADAATKVITQPRWKGEAMTGDDYFREHAVPNFYFHLTTAYALLRHNGVAVGKRDYLGTLSKFTP